MRALKRAKTTSVLAPEALLNYKVRNVKKATLPVAAVAAVVFCCLPLLSSRCAHRALTQNKRLADASHCTDGERVSAARQVESPDDRFLLPPPQRGRSDARPPLEGSKYGAAAAVTHVWGCKAQTLPCLKNH